MYITKIVIYPTLKNRTYLLFANPLNVSKYKINNLCYFFLWCSGQESRLVSGRSPSSNPSVASYYLLEKKIYISLWLSETREDYVAKSIVGRKILDLVEEVGYILRLSAYAGGYRTCPVQ